MASFSKCIYCESYIDHVYFGDIEHIIPKSVRPDLTYDWKNLGYVCAMCNNAKSDQYDPSLEIINPYTEDPTNHIIAFGSFMYPLKGSEKGQKTIYDAQLNRPGLIEKRRELIDRIDRAVQACYRAKNTSLASILLEELIQEAEPEKEYSMSVREYLLMQRIIE